jgi:hypothetical protein
MPDSKNPPVTAFVLALFLGACGRASSGAGASSKIEDAGSDTTSHLANELSACDLEQITMRVAGQEPWTDCGVLSIGAAPEVLSRAQTCVEDARDHEQPFRLLWAEQGIDSAVRFGVQGWHEQLGYHIGLFKFDSAGMDPDGAQAVFNDCRTLRFIATCTPPEQLCVACDSAGIVQCRCVLSENGATASVECG